MALPLTVQFNTHDEADTPVFEQGDNWENNIVWDSTRTVPQANYQGQRVNFSQPSDRAFNALIQAVGQTNYQVAINSKNLVKMGKDMTKIGEDNTWFGKSITNLNNIVQKLISQGTGNGMSRQQVENIVEDYHGDDITLLHENSSSLGAAQQAAKIQRDSLEAKIQSNKDEHGYFHDTLTELGKHTHGNGNGNGKDCGWFGEKCWDFDLGLGSSLTTMAAIGVGAYLLLKKK
jgi:hypothetical protein